MLITANLFYETIYINHFSLLKVLGLGLFSLYIAKSYLCTSLYDILTNCSEQCLYSLVCIH